MKTKKGYVALSVIIIMFCCVTVLAAGLTYTRSLTNTSAYIDTSLQNISISNNYVSFVEDNISLYAEWFVDEESLNDALINTLPNEIKAFNNISNMIIQVDSSTKVFAVNYTVTTGQGLFSKSIAYTIQFQYAVGQKALLIHYSKGGV